MIVYLLVPLRPKTIKHYYNLVVENSCRTINYRRRGYWSNALHFLIHITKVHAFSFNILKGLKKEHIKHLIDIWD